RFPRGGTGTGGTPRTGRHPTSWLCFARRPRRARRTGCCSAPTGGRPWRWSGSCTRGRTRRRPCAGTGGGRPGRGRRSRGPWWGGWCCGSPPPAASGSRPSAPAPRAPPLRPSRSRPPRRRSQTSWSSVHSEHVREDVRVRLAGEERTDRGLLLRGDRVRKGNLVGGEVPAAALPGGPAARRLRGYGDLVGGGHGGLLLAGGALVGLLRALTFRGGGPPPVAAGQEAGVRRGTRGQRRGVGGTAPGAHHPVPAAALVVVPDGGHRRGSARTRPPRVGTGTHPCVSR